MIRKKKQDGWYQRKKYPHFDLPLSFEKAQKFVTDPVAVAQHAFYPFLAYEKSERKVKRVQNRKKTNNKLRPIRYAAHKDGYIYAYYSKKLTALYEDKLKERGLDNCVLAYRTDLGLSNIEFSYSAMEEIRKRKTCVAVTCDISGFYDSLDHQHLKKQWCELLGVSQLPADHYNIFKSVTRYSLVSRDVCYEALGVERCTKENPHPAPTPRPLCSTPSEFRRRIREGGLIQRNAEEDGQIKKCGIPQGSPISSCLSNIYMLPFDRIMQAKASEIGGYYRRYCDDILWICDESQLATIQKLLSDEIKNVGSKLVINTDKTTITHFQETEDGFIHSHGDLFQYLGFTFDGKNAYIRPGTMSKYWRKVTFGIRRAKIQARKAAHNGGSSKVFKRKLYRTYTHLGKRNFITYAKRSHTIMNSPSIRKQVKQHWDMFQAKLSE